MEHEHEHGDRDDAGEEHFMVCEVCGDGSTAEEWDEASTGDVDLCPKCGTPNGLW